MIRTPPVLRSAVAEIHSLVTFSFMSNQKLRVLAVVGSLHDASIVRTVLLQIAEKFSAGEFELDLSSLESRLRTATGTASD